MGTGPGCRKTGLGWPGGGLEAARQAGSSATDRPGLGPGPPEQLEAPARVGGGWVE